MNTRVALVTTLRNPGPSIASFVKHHLRVGFARIFLFFDDPDDEWIALVPDDERVAVIPCDQHLRDCWADWPEQRAQVDEQVMARQILNAEVALQLARGEGIDWLVHLDADELLDCEAPIPTILAGVDPVILQITFPNLEVMPECADVVDMFRELTLFKRNPRGLPRGRFTAEQEAIIARCRPWSGCWFFYYTIGKSAVRVRPGVRPHGVHLFATPDGGTTTHVVTNPRVLHYMNAGFENFWRRYQTWGAFPDHWLGGELIRDRISDFHLAARDIVRTGDRELARRFYRDHVVVTDRSLVAALIEAGVCERIEGPSRMLDAC